MIRAFWPEHPYWSLCAYAALIGFLVYGVSQLDRPDDGSVEIAPYHLALFAMASIFMMFDVLECAALAKGDSRSPRDPHVWIYGFYYGYTFIVPIILLTWDTPEDAARLFMIFGLTAVLMGIYEAFTNKGTHALIPERYDTNKPLTLRPVGKLYFVWPIIVVALLAILTSNPSGQGYLNSPLLFHLVLLGAVMQFYRLKEDQPWMLLNWPKFVGVVFLAMASFI